MVPITIRSTPHEGRGEGDALPMGRLNASAEAYWAPSVQSSLPSASFQAFIPQYESYPGGGYRLSSSWPITPVAAHYHISGCELQLRPITIMHCALLSIGLVPIPPRFLLRSIQPPGPFDPGSTSGRPRNLSGSNTFMWPRFISGSKYFRPEIIFPFG